MTTLELSDNELGIIQSAMEQSIDDCLRFLSSSQDGLMDELLNLADNIYLLNKVDNISDILAV